MGAKTSLSPTVAPQGSASICRQAAGLDRKTCSTSSVQTTTTQRLCPSEISRETAGRTSPSPTTTPDWSSSGSGGDRRFLRLHHLLRLHLHLPRLPNGCPPGRVFAGTQARRYTFWPAGEARGFRAMDSYAIIMVGGKQYRVREGDKLLVDRLSAEEGKTFHPSLLFVGRDGKADLKPKAQVTAKVVGHVLGEK